MSKPSIRTGSSSIPSASWSAASDSTRALAAVLAAQPVLVEGEAGVALGQLAQAALVAALGGPHLDRRAAALAQRLGEQRRPARAGRGRRRSSAASPARPSSTGR